MVLSILYSLNWDKIFPIGENTYTFKRTAKSPWGYKLLSCASLKSL